MMYAIDKEDDFVEIFAEEAGGVFETIDTYLPVWRKVPTDGKALTEIRRGFHTLKGSGRMVNALDLAEVAWKIESMLNRAIDGSVQVTAPMIDLVSTARDFMPRLLDAFKNRRPVGADSEVEALMAKADALSAAQAPMPARAQPTVSAAALDGKKSPALEVVKLGRRLDQVQKRSDEALHRSEMALQHARRIGAHAVALKGEASDRVGREEFGSVIEQVDRLASDVRDLSRDTKHPRPPQPAQRRELNQLVDQLVRERMAPIQRQRGDLERQLGEARRAAAASRNLAGWALALSALSVLAGAGAIAALMMMSGLTLG